MGRKLALLCVAFLLTACASKQQIATSKAPQRVVDRRVIAWNVLEEWGKEHKASLKGWKLGEKKNGTIQTTWFDDSKLEATLKIRLVGVKKGIPKVHVFEKKSAFFGLFPEGKEDTPIAEKLKKDIKQRLERAFN